MQAASNRVRRAVAVAVAVLRCGRSSSAVAKDSARSRIWSSRGVLRARIAVRTGPRHDLLLLLARRRLMRSCSGVVRLVRFCLHTG